MTFKNLWKITSSYDFQVHQQCSQRRYYFQTALQWFKVLQYVSPALPGAPVVVARPPIAMQMYHKHYAGAHEGYCIGPVNSGIWPHWDSGPTTPKHSKRFPVTKTHFADDNLDHGDILPAVQPSWSPRFKMLGPCQILWSWLGWSLQLKYEQDCNKQL